MIVLGLGLYAIVKLKKAMKTFILTGILSLMTSFFVSTVVAILNSILGIFIRKFT